MLSDYILVQKIRIRLACILLMNINCNNILIKFQRTTAPILPAPVVSTAPQQQQSHHTMLAYRHMQDVEHIDPGHTPITTMYNIVLQGLLGGQGITGAHPPSTMQVVPFNEVVFRVRLLEAQLSRQLNLSYSVSFIN